jgi:hypothetical protein
MYAFFPQSFFVIPLWKLEYVPFVMVTKSVAVKLCKQNSTPSALGRIAPYCTILTLGSCQVTAMKNGHF